MRHLKGNSLSVSSWTQEYCYMSENTRNTRLVGFLERAIATKQYIIRREELASLLNVIAQESARVR